MSRRVLTAEPGSHPESRGTLLEVVDLTTRFRTERGTVHAVDGVSFTLDRGRTLGVVGESGSGKTVLSRSVMGLLPARNVERSGHVFYEGTDIIGYDQKRMSDVWGAEMAMVFQDPMTSLNPVMKIGAQITESLRHHLGVDRKEAEATADRAADLGRHPRARAPDARSTPTSSPAACASASPSPSRSPAVPRSCSPTSPPPRSTSPSRPRSSTSSPSSSASATWR